MKTMLSPSIMCADLLNLETEIHRLEEAKVDLIHFDIMDSTFTTTTMLPPLMLPAMRKITAIPLDIHVMIDRPERIMDTILPHIQGAYVSIHTEVTKEIQSIFRKVKNAGGRVSAALNYATPLCMLEELIPMLDMVLLVLGNAGNGAGVGLDDQLLDKIARTRKMLDEHGRRDVPIEVDGGVSFDVARRTKAVGASIFVLGTKSVYQPGVSVVERCNALREYLQ